MKVATIIPALNEANSIARVVHQIPRIIDGEHPVSVVVVDDGSTDDTASIAHDAGADIVHSHRTNLGVGAGFRTGIKLCLDIGADVICTLDADGQFNPLNLPDVVRPITSNMADAVIGSRFNSRYANKSIPLSNRISNGLMALWLSFLLCRIYSDVSSGFRAFHVRTLNNLRIDKRWNTHAFVFDLKTSGFRVKEVPVSVKYFANRKSKAIRSFRSYASSALMDILSRILPFGSPPATAK